MNGSLTTHVLDIAHGCPAEGMKVQLWREDAAGTRTMLREDATNADGRLHAPLLENDHMQTGIYELHFFTGPYFSRFQTAAEAEGSVLFADWISIRFHISNPNEHYHVPLLAAPGGYSTYRGS